MYFSCLFVSFHVFQCLFACKVQFSVLILVVKRFQSHFSFIFFFQLITDCSNGDYSKLNKTICCQYIPFSHFIMYFSFLFVSFRISLSLSSPCLFVCEVQTSVLILVVKKVSITLLVHFLFQLIKVGSSGDYSKLNKTICCQYIPCLFAFYNVFFVSFCVFSCLSVSFRL